MVKAQIVLGALLVACSLPDSANAQQRPDILVTDHLSTGSAMLPSCGDATGNCPEIVPVNWNLAESHEVSAGGDWAQSVRSGSSASPLGDNGNWLAPAENAEDLPTITSNRKSERQKWADHTPSEYATHPGFWKQAGSIKTELLLLLSYFSLQSGKKLFRETTSFHFHDENWFGKSTTNLGIDKMTHAFDTYLIAEILHMRLHKNTDASEGDAQTAAILASTLMALNEISDGIETDSGYSMQDIAMNLIGAGFSLLRNTVPELKEKVSFKIEIIPNHSVYSYRGQKHYEQQRYMLSLKGAGFKKLERTPLRFVDLQVGYYGTDFRTEDRLAGHEPKRHVFVGLGLNVGELLFANSGSRIGKAGYTVLDYLQPPYTSIRYDTTGRLGH